MSIVVNLSYVEESFIHVERIDKDPEILTANLRLFDNYSVVNIPLSRDNAAILADMLTLAVRRWDLETEGFMVGDTSTYSYKQREQRWRDESLARHHSDEQVLERWRHLEEEEEVTSEVDRIMLEELEIDPERLYKWHESDQEKFYLQAYRIHRAQVEEAMNKENE